MPWVEVLAAFVACHLAGDFLAQTEFQARHKHGGLGRDPVRRRALAAHVATYALCFAPALAWLAGDVPSGALAAAVAGIAVPHAVQDDGRLVDAWMRRVKHTEPGSGMLAVAVDQSFHVIALLAVAVAVGA